ncbi:hypothetical protein [Mucilaginibacter arboris]|uniref:Carboxypeptidase regulatory-like domain-containing protein n=1 Tax=Mucilaginibacter arboris TaxID=2682090 RepID=A0A7K1SWI4_9SPHI|nr:hypothetical protein [Mucilaginibacter arboris]MVN21681.1 hypothetical protein [Mucilaginibacter arboris]
MRNLLSLFVFLLMACFTLKPNQKVKQGICGTVLLKQGNQMPGPGRAIANGQPVIREIVIYKLTNISEVKNSNGIFSAIKTAWVAKTTSNAKGWFEVALPAGQYSVFIIEKEGLYANYFNGKGSINPVEVLPDSLTHKDIYISNKAVF